jgi:hypothetical protein
MLRNEGQREAQQEAMRERMETPREVAFEEHFTVQELAQIWKLSRRTVQRRVEKDPEVIRIGTEKPGVRRHYTLRIPVHVARRIYQSLTGQTEEPVAEKPQARFRPSLLRRKRTS